MIVIMADNGVSGQNMLLIIWAPQQVPQQVPLVGLKAQNKHENKF